MAIYVVTGKLGGGKTLAAVSKINDALGQGRRVATNLDLELCRLPSVGKRARNTRVVRVPDQPNVDDIQNIGFGVEGIDTLEQARRAYNEETFGLLVLDECGTWLNARDWSEAGRRELINLLLHIRKHLWDVYLIIQDISMLDKQARKALAEHVVYCRRFDRISLPVVGFLSSVILGKRLSMPKLHMGIVKYGDQPNSMTVDRWWYNGANLYRAYDTTQVFRGDYQTGLYSLLPPWFLHSQSLVKWDWRKVLRLTKIYLRKWSQTALLAAGVAAGAVFAYGVIPAQAQPELVAESLPIFPAVESPGLVPAMPGESLFRRLRVSSYFEYEGKPDLVLGDGAATYRPDELLQMGIRVSKTGPCRWRLNDVKQGITRQIRCFG